MNRSLRLLSAAIAIAVLALPVLAKDDALSLVPANAVTVGMVKVAELRGSPLSSVVFQHMDSVSMDGDAQKFLTEAGLSLTRDIDVVVVSTSPRTTLGTEADPLVIAEGRFNSEKLTAALVSRGAVKKGGYLLMPHESSDGDHDGPGAVAFPKPSIAIAGTERAVATALATLASGGSTFGASGLAMDLARINRNASAWALVDVARAQRLTNGGTIHTGSGQSGDALATALKSVSTVAFWATDKGDALELGARGFSGDKETLVLLEDTMRGALSAMRLAVREKSPDLVSVLRKFEITRSDDSILIEGSIPADTLRTLATKKTASASIR